MDQRALDHHPPEPDPLAPPYRRLRLQFARRVKVDQGLLGPRPDQVAERPPMITPPISSRRVRPLMEPPQPALPPPGLAAPATSEAIPLNSTGTRPARARHRTMDLRVQDRCPMVRLEPNDTLFVQSLYL